VTAPRVAVLDGVRGLAIALVMPLHFVGQFDGVRELSIVGKVARAGWVETRDGSVRSTRSEHPQTR
jgi:peptidoglycan/LPS O-acetylase OafA/YrhL